MKVQKTFSDEMGGGNYVFCYGKDLGSAVKFEQIPEALKSDIHRIVLRIANNPEYTEWLSYGEETGLIRKNDEYKFIFRMENKKQASAMVGILESVILCDAPHKWYRRVFRLD